MIHLARRGYAVTGIDASAHMLEQARRKLEEEGLDLPLVRGDICDLSAMPEAGFDAAICMFSTLGLLKGVPMRLAAVRQAMRVLRPGGLYACHVHNKWFQTQFPGGWRSVIGEWISSLGPGWEFGDQVMPRYRGVLDLYLHSFSQGELRRLLEAAGLQVIRQMPLNAERTGEYSGSAPWRKANGFLMAARRGS